MVPRALPGKAHRLARTIDANSIHSCQNDFEGTKKVFGEKTFQFALLFQAKSAEMLAVVTDDVEREKTKCREAGITLTEDTTTTSSTQAENKPTHPPADTATPTDTTASRTNEETDVVNRN